MENYETTEDKEIILSLTQLTRNEFDCCKALYTNPYAISGRQVQFQIGLMRMIEAGHKVPEKGIPITILIKISRENNIKIPSHNTILSILNQLSKKDLVKKREISESEKIRASALFFLNPTVREYARTKKIF